MVNTNRCITRLRLELKDDALVNEKVIKSAGISGVKKTGKNAVQVIVGTQVQFAVDKFTKLCNNK